MTEIIRIHLTPNQFTEKESIVVEKGEFTASCFRFQSGVCAIRLKNSLGELVMLPYQGQQIWDVTMRGRRLTMKSMFDQPYPTHSFLHTFGGFFQHCGATAMGVPGPEDKHQLHGDLPVAQYQSAFLELGEDQQGSFISLGGNYRHTMAFNNNYLAAPRVKLYAGSSVFHVSLTVTNLKKTPMPLMYMAHINFRPVDDGRLVSTVKADPEHMRVRAAFPDFMEVDPSFRSFVEDLKAHPEKHMILSPEMKYDPEVVLFVDYEADADGWAHSLQIHPDGSADVVRHRTDQLGRSGRWICRTPDQDALGIEPGTAEGTGFNSEKAKGNVKYLNAGEQFETHMQIGVLTAEEARLEEQRIQKLVKAD
jgi:hypothetical protein